VRFLVTFRSVAMSNLKERGTLPGINAPEGAIPAFISGGWRREGILESNIATASLVAVLRQRDQVSEEEEGTLAGLGWRMRDFARGAEIVPDRSRPSESCLLVAGLAARAVILRNGSRQITAVHVPGDFVDLHGMLLEVMDHSVAALGDCRVAFVEHSALKKLSSENPRLWRLMLVTLAVDAAIQRAWMVGLGRRNPLGHLAHLFCELFLRLKAIGAVVNNGFELRIGQAEIADMLGLSVVHTNRTLQELRSSGAIVWNNGRVIIQNWDTLAGIAEFDPTYLNLACSPS
jgi:CRP-like cAMP-binding protein